MAGVQGVDLSPGIVATEVGADLPPGAAVVVGDVDDVPGVVHGAGVGGVERQRREVGVPRRRGRLGDAALGVELVHGVSAVSRHRAVAVLQARVDDLVVPGVDQVLLPVPAVRRVVSGGAAGLAVAVPAAL